MLFGQEHVQRHVETDREVGREWQGVRTLILILPFATTESRELLDTLRRHRTAHHALLIAILDVLRGSSVPATGETPPAPSDQLSPSELRVLRYLPTNLTRSEIAGELHVTVNTVNTHVRSIYSKLGAHDRSAAVRQARESRLLSSVASRTRKSPDSGVAGVTCVARE